MNNKKRRERKETKGEEGLRKKRRGGGRECGADKHEEEPYHQYQGHCLGLYNVVYVL